MSDIGVQVTTSVRSGPSNPGIPAGVLHVAGLTEKGPSSRPVTVRSLADFEAVLGGRTAYSNAVYDTARLFWEEGGSELVVSRVVGPGAAKGTLELVDTAATTPVPTVRVEAIDPGAYSTDISIEVVSEEASTFLVNVYRNGVLVNRYPNLNSPADLVAASSANLLVNFTDLGSATAAPGNNPAPIAPTPLSAGSDDRAGVTAATVIEALDAAGEAAAGGAVATPGFTADIIGVDLLAHAATHSKIALLAADQAATVDDVIAIADTLGDDVNGAYGGLFYPHMVIPDGSGTRIVSPEGYIGAVRSRAFSTEGFWQVPAGDRARTRWAEGTNLGVDIAANNRLSAAKVNGITTTGTKVRLYNWSSLSADRINFGLLSARDTLNNLALQLTTALEPHVFATLDGKGHLLSKVKSAAVSVLAPVARLNGFYPRKVNGREEDPGYRVDVDTVTNTVESQAGNQVNVSVSVRLSPTAALIKVEIVKVPVTASI